ncbi:unnamed protein product [Nezara viridula]|uniref:F-box domain-containing protein n=1 Tax=Nezara viridula TaxID=85310 RepID=A0A9P0HSP3_NEZVI|nr:unnamed protein product [Nezara viridula]
MVEKTKMMDSVSLLPVEVAQKIFKFLSIKDLYQCMSVCKSWRNLINCNYVWGHFYKIYDIEQLFEEIDDDSDETKTLSPLCSYAIELKRFLLSPAFNWRSRRSNSYYINLKYRQWKVICCEPYIAMLYSSVNELHIFCCVADSVECIDVVSINLPVNSIEQQIFINKKYIVIGAFNITLVYKLIDKSFKLYKAFASKCDSCIISSDHAFNDFIQENILSDYVVFEKVLIGDMLWITAVNGMKHIINLSTGKQDMKQNLFLYTKAMQNSQYVLNYEDVNVILTDINGLIISSFRVSHSDKIFYMNKSILVICFPRTIEDDQYTIECREIMTGLLIRTLSVNERTRVTLHPKKSVLYLLSTQSDLYKVSSFCIDTGVIIWNYEISCGPHMFWGAFLTVVNERFLFVYPAPYCDDLSALFNLQGKLLYEEVYFTSGILIHFSDAVILAKEEGRLHVCIFNEPFHY